MISAILLRVIVSVGFSWQIARKNSVGLPVERLHMVTVVSSGCLVLFPSPAISSLLMGVVVPFLDECFGFILVRLSLMNLACVSQRRYVQKV